MKYKFKLSQNSDLRVDNFLVHCIEPKVSRAEIKRAIDARQLFVNGQITVKSNYQPRRNDVIEIEIPDLRTSDVIAQEINFKTVYEDDDILIIDKPNNLVVHPGAKNSDNTLLNGLANYFKESGLKPVERFGLIHRLDKQTTGLLMIAKTNLAHDSLSKQMRSRTITKTYRAWVKNEFKEKQGLIDAPIGRDPSNRLKMAVTEINSKEAKTRFRVLRNLNGFALVECDLLTGRTHQIRVHLSYINHPIVGDYLYGPKSKYDNFGPHLHAFYLKFIHPQTKEWVEFKSYEPEEFNKFAKDISEN